MTLPWLYSSNYMQQAMVSVMAMEQVLNQITQNAIATRPANCSFGSIFAPYPMMNMSIFNMPCFIPNITSANNSSNKVSSNAINNSQTSNNTNTSNITNDNNNNSNMEKVSLSEALNKGLEFCNQKQKDRWEKLNPKLQRDLMKLVEYGKSQGITIYIYSSYRTEAEQQALVRAGRPAAKKGSRHLTGRAVDIRVSGNRTKNLAIIGKYWRDVLKNRWGQDFRNPMPEPWHIDIG